MKKTLTTLITTLVFILVLAACGTKSQEDVLAELDQTLNEMTGYKVNATMVLNTGEEPITYDIEIWHKKPHFYRVNLQNPAKDQNQMILRNNDGVFVLTPALNKSFRFQSEWPENNSQVYLIESLVSDILNDSESEFEATEDAYVFVTKTNYQNKNLARQEVTLSKENLLPTAVKVMDQDMNELVNLQFSDVELNAKFDDGAFDMERNMTGAKAEIPVMASNEKTEFNVLYPSNTKGLELAEQKELTNADGKEFVLQYEGKDRSFTLIQRKSEVEQATKMFEVANGQPVSLGFAVGAMNDNSITWSHDGVDYFLASNDLTNDEMIDIATSVYAPGNK